MSFITPIYDRTQADVDRVKYLTTVILNGTNTSEELQEFQNDMKGALNYSDLNRIENNLTELATYFGLTLVNMNRDTIPRVPYFNNVLTNVSTIRNSIYRKSSSPNVPAMPLNVYSKINDIEKIIWNAYDTWIHNQESFIHCGDGTYLSDNLLL